MNHRRVASVQVRRGEDRFLTQTDWLDSRSSFSFGHHYDPENTHHGLLMANNEDIVAPGGGFGCHPHRDVEILTWVVAGALAHRDSSGQSGVLAAGQLQHLSAGHGVRHSEHNASSLAQGSPVHLVQMWLRPDEFGRAPRYAVADVSSTLLNGELVPVASGIARHNGDRAIALGNKHAALHLARLGARALDNSAPVQLPEAPFLHLFVATGTVEVEGVAGLLAGDAVRFTAAGGHRVTATESSEIMVWEMHASVTD